LFWFLFIIFFLGVGRGLKLNLSIAAIMEINWKNC